MSSPLIKIRNLSKVYRRNATEVRSLENLNLSVSSGDFIALMGPSGSGKSTLLNMIAGLDTPTSGSVYFAHKDISRMSTAELAEWRNRHIGFIFQSFNLLPVLTAFENVELPLLLTGLNKKERTAHTLAALRAVGLADRASHYPKQLSGGQEQRVAVARAIVTDPSVIIADEPTGDLDASSADDIFRLLQELNFRFGKTIVMVTHDERALRYASTCKRLNKGRLLEEKPEEAMSA